MPTSLTAENSCRTRPGSCAVRPGRPGYVAGLTLQEVLLQQRGRYRYQRRFDLLPQQRVARFGIEALSFPGKTELRDDGMDIASIGIGVRHWTTRHGLALNLHHRLKRFDSICPLRPAGSCHDLAGSLPWPQAHPGRGRTDHYSTVRRGFPGRAAGKT